MEYFFKSHYSLKSILTLSSSEDEIRDDKPVSIASIAKKHSLPYVFLVEDDMGGFFEAYKALEEICPFYFGWRVTMCDDIKDIGKDNKSRESEHKIIIFAKNTQGYHDLIKLHNKAQIDGKYYVPRVDSSVLEEFWTDNLKLVIPFFDSHIYNSYCMFRSILPNFKGISPTYIIENHPLPFLDEIQGKVVDFCEKNQYPTLEARTVYYYRPEDFEAYQTYRCIGLQKRVTLDMPNFDGMGANTFSFL